jgi:hypothetical protein
MKAQQTKLETGMKVEVVLNVARWREEQNPHNFFRALEIIKDRLEVWGASQVLGFVVVIHACSAGKDRVLTAHGVQRDPRPFAFVIWARLRRSGDVAQNLQIAQELINVVSSGKPYADWILSAGGGHG